jgi:LysM repeat protein
MIKKLLLLLIISLLSLKGHSQKSEEIRRIDGKKYYVHTVQQGHTLYAISKVYSVSIDEITEANPGVNDGLSIGEEVLIPLKSVDKKEAKANPPEIEDGQLIHTVVKGETLYSISKKYKVSVEELTKNNQQLIAGLQPGMKLLINQQTIPDLEVTSIEPALPENYITHEVLPKETLYGISKMYNVEISEIVEINPSLSDGLKVGMIINLPIVESEITEQNENIAILSKPITKKVYKVALFLPFNLAGMDSTLARNTNAISPSYNSYSIASVEFYNGFRMALDSLIEKGLSLELSVFDVSSDWEVQKHLLDPRLKEQDLFIGPFHYSSFQLMADFASKHQIKIVSPINHPNKLLLTNPNLLECEVSDYTQVSEIAYFLNQLDSAGNNLMLSNFDYKNKPLCDEFEKQARRIGLPYDAVSVEFSDREFDLILPQNLAVKLDSTKVNRIVVVSNDGGYISRLFDRMNTIDTSKYAIEVYGLNSWLKINQINTRYKVKYHVTMATSHFINYEDENLIGFIDRYYALHNTNPSANGFAFMGFDIANYHLSQLLYHGTNFEQYFSIEESYEGLQSIFNYYQFQSNSGYENKGLYFVQYNDYELVRVGDNKDRLIKIKESDIFENDGIPSDTLAPVRPLPVIIEER